MEGSIRPSNSSAEEPTPRQVNEIIPYEEILQADELPDWMFEFSESQKFFKCVEKPTENKIVPLDLTKDDSKFITFASEDRLIEPENKVTAGTSLEQSPDDNETECVNDVPTIYRTPRQRISISTKNIINDLEASPKKVRAIPAPLMSCPENEEIWETLINKEEAMIKYRNYEIFRDRSACLPRMRGILLDWIMEVSDVYRLRRNTYYLAVDYIDRFLTVRPSVPKTQLQLLGISCLFIAAKLEEIYPPKLTEFAYVCDGACTEKEILSCEILLLNVLSWDVNVHTSTGWLNLYMQIYTYAIDAVRSPIKLSDKHFQYPQYSGYQFIRASNIMDFFSMDPAFYKFTYSVIAAASLYFVLGKSAAILVSGLKWKQLKHCVKYMAIYHRIIQDTDDPRFATIIPYIEDERLACSFKFIRKHVPKVISDENHCLQTHLLNLDYFEKSVIMRIKLFGLDAVRVYIKKMKSQTGEMVYLTSYEENTANGVVVMYELTPTKENLEDCGAPAPLHPADPDYEPGQINIFALRKKTIVTLDDILASIHNDCALSKLKVPLQQLSANSGYQ